MDSTSRRFGAGCHGAGNSVAGDRTRAHGRERYRGCAPGGNPGARSGKVTTKAAGSPRLGRTQVQPLAGGIRFARSKIRLASRQHGSAQARASSGMWVGGSTPRSSLPDPKTLRALPIDPGARVSLIYRSGHGLNPRHRFYYQTFRDLATRNHDTTCIGFLFPPPWCFGKSRQHLFAPRQRVICAHC